MTLEHCPHCGARVINRKATRCWLCHTPFTDSETASAGTPPPPADEAIRAGSPLPSRSTALQAGPPGYWPPREELASDNPVIVILGLILLLSVIGFALSNAAGIGIVLAVFVTPALLRVFYFSLKQDATTQQPLTLGQKVLFFFTSLGVVTMIGVASFAAFYATCFVICLGGLSLGNLNRGGHGGYEWIMFVSVGGGLIVGIVVLVLTVRSLWVRKV